MGYTGPLILTLSSIYTHFNTLKKNALENIAEKSEIAQYEKVHFFSTMFSMHSVS